MVTAEKRTAVPAIRAEADKRMDALESQIAALASEMEKLGQGLAVLSMSVLSMATPSFAGAQAPIARQKTKSRGRRQGIPVVDTHTGKTYPTKSAAGMAVASEYGLIPHNYIWYEIQERDPERFKPVG